MTKINRGLIKSVADMMDAVISGTTMLFIKNKILKTASVNIGIEYEFNSNKVLFESANTLSISLDRFKSFVSQVTGEEIIHKFNKKHTLSCNKVTTSISASPADLFEPVINKINKNPNKINYFTVPQNKTFLVTLEHMIEIAEKVEIATLSAIKFKALEKNIDFFAMDRCRFLFMQLDNTDKCEIIEALAPIKIFKIFKLLMNFGGDNNLIFSENHITIRGDVGDFIVNTTAPLLEGKLPNTQKLLDDFSNASDNIFEVTTQKFLDALRIYNAHSNSIQQNISIVINKSGIKINMPLDSKGDMVTSEHDKDTTNLITKNDITFSINLNMLSAMCEFLKHLKVDKISMKYINNRMIGFETINNGIKLIYIIAIVEN